MRGNKSLGIISSGIVRLHKAQPFESEALDKLAESMQATALLKNNKNARYFKSRTFNGGCMSFTDAIIFDERYFDLLLPEEVLAVGAHELNHIAKRHVVRRLPRTIFPAVILSAVMSYLVSSHPALINNLPLIGKSYGLSVSLITALSFLVFLVASFYVNAKWLRRQETECDLRAAELVGEGAVISALAKFGQCYPRQS